LELVYIDDVVAAFLAAMNGNVIRDGDGRCRVEPVFRPMLGGLAELIRSFHDGRRSLMLPDLSDPLAKRLYATYLSFLPAEGLNSPLDTKADQRGSLAEVLKSACSGQFFVSRTRPGVTRGKHYHDSKVEKFVVLEGEAIIRLRDIRGDHVTEIRVSGAMPQIIDIPPGYTHSLENVGQADLLTLFWADEIFNPGSPDTYFAEVDDEKY
jgi:UDP-2-acetamido-2,6-beta-L-arabino-hexul-4-ose reductase